jgi:hypothetical protein
MVELRGFEPLTSAVQAPARGDGAPPLPFRRAYCRSRAAGSGPPFVERSHEIMQQN